MSRAWLDAAAEAAFARAVTDVEAASGVELVIAVRRAARTWPHVPIAAGAAAAWLVLAYMLFSRPAFALASFLIDPLLAGVLVGVAVGALAPSPRWATSRSARRRAVSAAARATFVERGVHRTSARTGVLVYCALAEGMAALVPDVGVAAAVPEPKLREAEAAIDAAIARGGIATAEAVHALAPLLAAVPRQAADVNELADAVAHDIERRPRA